MIQLSRAAIILILVANSVASLNASEPPCAEVIPVAIGTTGSNASVWDAYVDERIRVIALVRIESSTSYVEVLPKRTPRVRTSYQATITELFKSTRERLTEGEAISFSELAGSARQGNQCYVTSVEPDPLTVSGQYLVFLYFNDRLAQYTASYTDAWKFHDGAIAISKPRGQGRSRGNPLEDLRLLKAHGCVVIEESRIPSHLAIDSAAEAFANESITVIARIRILSADSTVDLARPLVKTTYAATVVELFKDSRNVLVPGGTLSFSEYAGTANAGGRCFVTMAAPHSHGLQEEYVVYPYGTEPYSSSFIDVWRVVDNELIERLPYTPKQPKDALSLLRTLAARD